MYVTWPASELPPRADEMRSQIKDIIRYKYSVPLTFPPFSFSKRRMHH